MGAVQFFSVVLPAVFWPLAVALITWWQRESIGRLIDRVRSGRVFGQEFDAPPSDLAGAVEGGASSPEVEEVIRSASEVARPSLPTVSGEESSVAEPVDPGPFWVSMLGRLSEANQNDEDRRRSEVERVMQSAARWGALLARNHPNDVDDWEPVVQWKDDGEPEIVAIRRPASLSRRKPEIRELQRADYMHAAAVEEHAEAEREAVSAHKALRDALEPSAELRERAGDAEKREIQTRHQVLVTASKLESRRRRFDRG
jgi:hypothetical protein